jgi:membrane associated rhomboid family serine protease
MAGEHTVRALLSQPLPATVRGQVNLWLLTMLVVGREWATAIEFYEQSGDWGTLATATQARLLVARAYAEAGNFERALRCLDFVALSPRTLGGLDRQFWSARVAIAALAGDADELERLLGEESHRPRRGFERFAATWRGRCALARGATVEAQRLLTRALALTPPAAQAWRAALGEYLAAAANATSLPAPVPAAANPGYRRGQGMLANAVATAAPWRRLMDVEAPRGFTRALLLVLALAHVGHAVMLWWPPHVPLWHWLGNIPGAVRAGEWWRLVTALFLHAEWWHLAMNAAGLWVFGAGVERALGRWRMLAVFVVGGTLGNALSMWRGEYGVSFGASGSVFALLGAFWVALYRLNVPLYLRYRRQLLFLLTAMVLIDLTLGAMETQVDDLAHAGGFAAGLLVSLALTRGQKHRHALPTAL